MLLQNRYKKESRETKQGKGQNGEEMPYLERDAGALALSAQ